MKGKNRRNYKDYCIKAIPTKEKSYMITKDMLKKVYKEAKDCGKKPLLIMKIGTYNLEIYIDRNKR